MSMNLFLGRIHCLRPSLPLNRSTPLASSNAPIQASPPNSNFAVEYLVQSCGLSSEVALTASNRIQHLKSPKKPDAVLQLLRETGISESDIKTAVSRDPRLLCSDVEKNWRPNIAKLQELGFSIKDISGIIADNPSIFQSNFGAKIDFWMGVLGSVENLSVIFKIHGGRLLGSNLEKVLMPNLYFLQEQCCLSPRQIVRLMKSAPKLISSRPDILKEAAQRADRLVIARSSGSFIYALVVVSYQDELSIDTRLNNLRSLGLSQEEVALMISKAPTLLGRAEKLVGRMEYLIKEAGCAKIDVVRNPALLMYSLDNRLIPRNIVRKLLISKGLPVANLTFGTFARPSDEKFVDKFVLPYEHVIPGLHRAYVDASAGKIEVLNRLRVSQVDFHAGLDAVF